MTKAEELPSGAGELARTYPKVWEAYEALGISRKNLWEKMRRYRIER